MHPIHQLAPVATVCPYPLQRGFDTVGKLVEQLFGAIPVLNIDRMYDDLQQVPNCIDNDMPFAPADFLARVVTAPTARFRGFDALAVDNSRCWFRCTLQPNPLLTTYGLIDTLPGAIQKPFAELVVDASKRGKVKR